MRAGPLYPNPVRPPERRPFDLLRYYGRRLAGELPSGAWGLPVLPVLPEAEVDLVADPAAGAPVAAPSVLRLRRPRRGRRPVPGRAPRPAHLALTPQGKEP